MRKLFFLVFLLSTGWPGTKAQSAADAGAYLSRVSGAQDEMNQKYMAYVSAVAHSHRARKIEHLRTQALESMSNAKDRTSGLPNFGDDTTLRQAGIDYIQFCYRIFTGDFSKIVDVEEIAEQSVDQMQAYLILQETAARKLREATGTFDKAQRDFAAKYHVPFPDTRGELYEKIRAAETLSRYCDQVYIIYFKAAYEEQLLFRSMKEQKMVDAEQARVSLLAFANEGLQRITADSIREFEGDFQLAQSCRGLMSFYKDMAAETAPDIIDYYLKLEAFYKLKRTFEAKGKNLTKEDKKDFKTSEKAMNSQILMFNQQLQAMFRDRSVALENWNTADKNFRDRHTPYYKK